MRTSGDHVQYGCGFCTPAGWLNFDASPSLRLQRIPVLGPVAARLSVRFPPGARYGDILRGLPVPDGSAKAVYCSHVLEHLSAVDCRRALLNTFRVLSPGGCFRLVLPDLRAYATTYVRSPHPDASHRFLRETLLGREQRTRSLVRFIREEWMGNSKHQWMWDEQSLEAELASAGFDRIRRATIGDNPDPAFKLVEEPARWEGQLGMECFRPENFGST